jgi:hypothetical protein
MGIPPENKPSIGYVAPTGIKVLPHEYHRSGGSGKQSPLGHFFVLQITCMGFSAWKAATRPPFAQH